MKYITPAQAASTLGVSVRTVYRLLKNGTILATHDGKHWKIDSDNLPDLQMVNPLSEENEYDSDASLAGKFLPGEEDFISWMKSTKEQKDADNT